MPTSNSNKVLSFLQAKSKDKARKNFLFFNLDQIISVPIVFVRLH